MAAGDALAGLGRAHDFTGPIRPVDICRLVHGALPRSLEKGTARPEGGSGPLRQQKSGRSRYVFDFVEEEKRADTRCGGSKGLGRTGPDIRSPSITGHPQSGSKFFFVPVCWDARQVEGAPVCTPATSPDLACRRLLRKQNTA